MFQRSSGRGGLRGEIAEYLDTLPDLAEDDPIFAPIPGNEDGPALTPEQIAASGGYTYPRPTGANSLENALHQQAGSGGFSAKTDAAFASIAAAIAAAIGSGSGSKTPTAAAATPAGTAPKILGLPATYVYIGGAALVVLVIASAARGRR